MKSRVPSCGAMAYYINKILHLHSQWYRLCDGGLDSSDDLCCVSIRSWGGGSHERGSAGVEAFHGTGLLEDLAVAGHEHQVSFRRSTLTRLRCEYSWGYRLHSPLLKMVRVICRECWNTLFLTVCVSESTTTSFHVAVPDSITSWRAMAFVMSDNLGLGLTFKPQKVC